MNRFQRVAQALVVFLVLTPVVLGAQALAQVVYVSMDTARVKAADKVLTVEAGQVLSANSELSSGGATIILSICDGSLITVYPNSILEISALEADRVAMEMVTGEILGDSRGGCKFTIGTKAGEAVVLEGVFGIVLRDDGANGWTVQVRNLDGTVSFTGKPNLDTSGTIVTLLEPNKVVVIPPGEEFMIRGIYDEDADVFAIAREGVALAMLEPYSANAMRGSAEFMNNAWTQWLSREQSPTGQFAPREEGEEDEPPEQDEEYEPQDQSDPPVEPEGSEQTEQRVEPMQIINIPFDEIEVPSDKG